MVCQLMLYFTSLGCQRVDVNTGCTSSSSVTLSIDGMASFTCPSHVDKTNWLSTDTYGDRFSVTQDGDSVTVTRIDKINSAWCMHLSFDCCGSEEGTELNV